MLTEPRLNLRDVGFRLQRLRLDLGGGDSHELGAGAHLHPAFDRRGDDAAGDLGRDLGVVLRHERAARADEAGDRLLDGRSPSRCGRAPLRFNPGSVRRPPSHRSRTGNGERKRPGCTRRKLRD